MRRTSAVLVVPLAAVLSAAAAAPAAAAEPVEVVVDVPFDGSPGSFTADGGGLCAGGTYADSGIRTTGAGRGRERTLTFHLDRTFTCSDGSGSFTVRISARWHPCDATNAGTWVVLRGDGDYADLHGAGRLVGSYVGPDTCDPDGVVDVLSGRATLG